MDKALKISGTTVRLALIGVATIVLSGCADSGRLGDPYANPFQSSSRYDRTPTGAINQPQQQSAGNFFTEAFKPFDDHSAQRAPRPPADIDQPRYAPRRASSIQSQPLAPPRAAPAHDAWSAPAYAPGVTHSAALARPKAVGVGGWSAEGGTPIVIAQGESAEIIAQRYGVPVATLLRINGYNNRAQVQPGARMVIPVYHADMARAARLEAAPKPAAMERHEVASVLAEKRDKMAEARRTEAKSEEATRRAAEAKLKLAKREQEKADAEAKKLAAAKAAKETATVAMTAPQPAPHAAVDKASTTARIEAPASSAAVGGDAAHPEFRWPARGRVIQAFGAGGNDGINIAVPEGTPVKAAESGVVAYAGSELKGYGNLVLIRHPNGFVSAYANNGSLDVKRGDTVKRGQTIALSGQSGNVASPQLHFELRKGSKPVDPSSYLAGL